MKKRKAKIFSIILASFFIFVLAFFVAEKMNRPVHADSESDGGESDDGHFQVINTNPSNDKPQKTETKTITTRLSPTVTQIVTTTTRHDTDGDGLYDDVDPHPTINENFIVKDNNLDGIDDNFETPDQLKNVGVPGTGQKVDYKGQVIVDSDLDGLTDQGEIQIYHTDPGNPDSDGDGYLDGAEILAGTNPLDSSDYPGNSKQQVDSVIQNLSKGTPWVWYVSRASGMIGFIFLWLTVFLGLAIRNPLLKKIIQPIYSFGLHAFAGAMAIFWSLVHGTSFLFHGSFALSFKEVAIPFYSHTALVNPTYMSLGIIAFYLMVIMAVTSFLRSHMNHWLWRVLHFLNPVAFIFVVVHGYFNGTDINNNFYVGSAFLFSSFILVVIYLISLGAALAQKFGRDPVLNQDN